MRIIVSLLLAVLSAQAQARANYHTDVEPTVKLRGLGAITIAPFSHVEFIQRLKDADANRLQSYRAAAPEANRQVQAALKDVLSGYNGGLKPRGLTLHAELLDYRTGDANTRAHLAGAGFGIPRAGGAGSGFVQYRVELRQGKTLVAEFRVTSELRADKQRGYRAAAAFMRDFIEDYAD